MPPQLKSLLPSAIKLRRLCFYRRVSVHRGGCLLAPGVCVYSGGCLLQGGCGCLGVVCSVPPGRDGYCCGWYASHWNAFLFPCGFCSKEPLGPSDFPSLDMFKHQYYTNMSQSTLLEHDNITEQYQSFIYETFLKYRKCKKI